MAMTFSDAAISIRDNNWFRARVLVAVSNYTNYLLNSATSDPEYDAKVQAGQRLATQSEHVVQTLLFTLAGDSEVQAAGPAIPDSTLQVLVEKTVKLFWPVTPPAGMFAYPGGTTSYIPPIATPEPTQ